MLTIIIVSLLVSILVFKFVKGYLNSKRELSKSEVAFRGELLDTIREKYPLTPDVQTNINTLNAKQLTSYLEDLKLIDQDTYNRLLNKHFGQN